MAFDGELVQRYADEMMKLIENDAREGRIPRTVLSFSGLHDYLDANGYAEDAGVPHPAGDYEMINAVETRVDEMLAEGALNRQPQGNADRPDSGLRPDR